MFMRRIPWSGLIHEDWQEGKVLKEVVEKGGSSKKKPCLGNPCEGRNPAVSGRSWQGRPSDDMYIGKDSYKNVVVKKGTVLYTLHPHGPNTPSYFVDDKQLSSTHGKGARTYNDALQIGHTGNSTGKYARDMRTTLHKFVVTEDTCMAFGEAKANP